MKHLDLIIGGSVVVFVGIVSYAMAGTGSGSGSIKASPYKTKKRQEHYDNIMEQVNTDRGKNDQEGGSRRKKRGKNRKTKKY
jgi:hypothetical protein